MMRQRATNLVRFYAEASDFELIVNATHEADLAIR
jgi:hypothetical protein